MRAPTRSRALALSGGARLAPHELAYLRAVSQGIAAVDAAAQYLRLGHGAMVPSAHRLIVERARAIARRLPDPRWRLLGATIARASAAAEASPSVEEWAAQQGLDGWAWDELVAMHADRFGGALPPAERRRATRNARLIEQRLALLQRLQQASPVATLADPLDAWLVPGLAEQLRTRCVLTLADLRALIARGGRWWVGIPAFGPVKAARLAAHVDALLGPAGPSNEPGAWQLDLALQQLDALQGQPGLNRLPPAPGGLQASNDRDAMAAWIVARSGSYATSALYQREAERFLMWAALRGCDIGSVAVADCSAYIDFLASVPPSWCSRSSVRRLAPGWRPFRGPLDVCSQQQAITVVRSLFAWLAQAGYLARNPWVLVNCTLGDAPVTVLDPTSRAFTPAAWSALQAELSAAGRPAAAAAAARMRWVLVFCAATGLRASELILARRGALRRSGGIWTLAVFGKGRKAREVVVPSAALQATRDYFEARGLSFETCAPTTPLLGSLSRTTVTALVQNTAPQPSRPRGAIGYSALHKAMKRLIERAARRVPVDERETMLRASLHWLRHTFATRAAEAGVVTNDIQEQLGQADPRVAAAYSRAQIHQRAAALETVVLGRAIER